MEPKARGSLMFTVRRQEAELVAPAKPTPRELKPLSDIDSQMNLRFQVPGLLIYKNNPSMNGMDPVKVIREAIAKTLVFYYPFAGRLREGPGLKLSVDCTGEGVMFVEADADVALDDFGAVIHPPFPCWEELLFDVPGSADILHCPLLLFQVTRLKCGGYIVGFRLNHAMSDAPGIVQFLTTVAETARGALSPSTLPCWNRDFFSAKHPHHMTYDGRFMSPMPLDEPFIDTIEKCYFFDRSHISALRKLVPRDLLARFSTFDVLTAHLWRCRTVALDYDPIERVHVGFLVAARGCNMNPQVPSGYYGNAFEFTMASTTVEELCSESLGHAIRLIRKAKADVTEESIRSNVERLAVEGSRELPSLRRSFMVSDVRHAGFDDVDFGWGPAAYGGAAVCASGPMQGLRCFYGTYKDRGAARGEDVVTVLVSLPRAAMESFESQLYGPC